MILLYILLGGKMCTAISKDGFWGRTLDLDGSRGEEVVIMPRRFPIRFRREADMAQHPAIIGCALVNEGVPLWFDAVNEYGLAAAGLNFPDNAVYFAESKDKENITPFEFIPYILGLCADVDGAVERIKNMNIKTKCVQGEYQQHFGFWYSCVQRKHKI